MLAVWIATCGGVGYLPVAPGSAGSAVGAVLVAIFGSLPLPRPWFRILLVFVVLGMFLMGTWAATSAERFYGRTDPGQVVIDEVAGQLLTCVAQPDFSWKWIFVAFILFRAFDIIKPFPVRRAERLPGGWGIMMDDVIAGAYSAGAVAVLARLIT